MRSSLATIITAFERVYFGRRTASDDMFRECADAYENGFEIASSSSTSMVEHEPA
jgi:hypothetical protein